MILVYINKNKIVFLLIKLSINNCNLIGMATKQTKYVACLKKCNNTTTI
jgi:hypothetical protein